MLQNERLAMMLQMTLCLLVALTPLVFAARLFEPYISAKEILVQAGTATAALIWLVTVRANSWTMIRTPVWIPLIVLILIGAASMLWSSNSSVSFDEVQRLATYVLLFAIALDTMWQADARSGLATALMLAGGIEAVYVLLQYTVGDPIFPTGQLNGKWQTFGTMGNPNWTGEFLAVAALVALGHLIVIRTDTSARPFVRHLTLAALILISLALAATLARGAWLGFVVGGLALLIARRHYINLRRSIRSFIVPAAVAAAAAAIVIVLPLLANPQAIGHLFNFKSINGRVLMSAVSWSMIRDAPWGGHGLGTFGLQFPLYQAQAFSQEWAAPFIGNASFTTYAHNDFLQLWAEIGVFGLIAFGWIVWIVLKRGRVLANDPVALACWAAVISLLVNAAVGFPLHLPASLMLFVVLIAVVESAASKKTVGLSSLPFAARGATVIVTLILCFSAYQLSYDLFVSDAALWRGNVALENEQWDDAGAEIRTAIRSTPNSFVAQTMMGELQVRRGEYEQAIHSLNKAQRFGYSVKIFDLKATAVERTGQRSQAIEVLNELIRLRPDLQWPHERLSSLENEANDHTEKKQ